MKTIASGSGRLPLCAFATVFTFLLGQPVNVLHAQGCDSPPIPVCNASVVVPLGNQGTATIPAEAFDGGSSDDCDQLFFKVRRMDPPLGFQCYDNNNTLYQFDDVIKFCCEDVGNANLMIILRVYDVEPVPGVVSDDYLEGHFADCMLQVQIQDKTGPVLICPSDLTISCMFLYDPENLSVFGDVVTNPGDREDICLDDPGNPNTIGLTCIGIDGLATDNCWATIVEEDPVFDMTGACGTGSIRRIFTATDPGGLSVSCEQHIEIINYVPFTENDISWPPDSIVYDICQVDLLDPEDLPAPHNRPVVVEDACDLVASTHEDLVFDFSHAHQACFKILRNWTVIDWCQYQVGGSDGIWTHQQIIKVINTMAPEITLTESEVVICTDDPGCGPGNVVLEASATDDCSGPDALRWTIGVDEDNNGSLEQLFTPIFGESAQVGIMLPLGTHRILYSVEDFCGNMTTEEQYVTVVSCKLPSPKGLNLATSLRPLDLDGDDIPDWGTVTVWASDVDAGSDHPCGTPIHLAFSTDPSNTSMVFDCSDLGDNLVDLWVIDDHGNADFCTVTVTVQDNFSACPDDIQPHGTISGKIATAHIEEVAGVPVKLLGSSLPAQSTGANGNYTFPPMPYGGNYQIEPVLDTEHKNGVSTLDLILLQKHLLGVQALESPHQIIAADANRSQSLSAMDVVILRRLILGNTETIPNNTSWRFVEAGYQFADPANPLLESFPESYNIESLSGDMDIDFIAMKVGDINGSVMTGVQNGSVVSRNAPEILAMQIQDQFLEAGESTVINITSDRIYEIEAMQFTFEWDPEIIEVTPVSGSGLLTDMQWSTDHLAKGMMPVSWTKYDGLEGGGGNVIVSLRITARTNLSLSQTGLSIGSQITPVEGILENGVEIQPRLIIMPVTVEAAELLAYQNRPNPFNRKSILPVVVPDACAVKLEVHNVEGRLVHQETLAAGIGYNEFLIDARSLGGPGVYTCTVSTAAEYRTLRMIVVDE